MKKIALFLCLLIITQTTKGQVATVHGVVVDELSRAPLKNATVSLKNSEKTVKTDSSGHFQWKEIPRHASEIIFSSIGYQTKKLSLLKTLPDTITLQSKAYNLDEIVITGTMKAVSKLNSPVSVEVFQSSFLKKNGSVCLIDAIGNINGVRPQLNCNVCNTSDIRINGMDGPYTMILIDGMPIVSSLSTVYGLHGIPTALVKQIEIVKGPASSLYGSEAVAGLINIITQDPKKKKGVSFDVSSSTQGEINNDLGYSTTIGKLSTILGVNYFNFNNRLDVNSDNFIDMTNQNRISIFNKWTIKRPENRKANLMARYLYEDRFGGQTSFRHHLRGSDKIYGESIYTSRFELLGNYELPMRSQKINFQYSFNNHDQDSYYGNFSFKANQKVAFGQLVWDKKLGKRHDALLGLGLRYTFYDDNSPVHFNPHTWLPGVFIQDEITLNPQHKVLVGMRYDYNSSHGSILSPRVNYKWSLSENSTLRFGIGNGFRVVNLFTEDHAALSGAREVVIESALKPEKSYNATLNFVQKFSSPTSAYVLDATAFYTHFSNKIIGDFFSDPEKIIYNNLNGYAVSKGVSVNLNINLNDQLDLILGGTLMDVYSKNNDQRQPQLQAPNFTGNWTISYHLEKLGLDIDYTGSVSSPMHLPVLPPDIDPRPGQSPWFSLQNLQLSRDFKKLQVYGGIKNLLNFLPRDPILNPADPFGSNFDPSYNYAPMQGIRGFVGIRYNY